MCDGARFSGSSTSDYTNRATNRGRYRSLFGIKCGKNFFG
jgi:hypothetical protein